MNVTISYRHLDSSPSIDQTIKSKLEHLDRFFDANIKADWVCSVEKDRHRSEVNIHVGSFHFHAHDESENLYKTIDKVVSKLEKQMAGKSKKVKDHIHHKHQEKA